MKKLLEFQKKVSAISKDSENPFFKSKYFDINKVLENIKPLLSELGLVIAQPLLTVNGRPAIATILVNVETNEALFNNAIVLPDLTDPQKMGSAITYYRRYSLQSLLALESEDDDGNLASSNANSKVAQIITPPKKVEPSKKEKIANLCKKLGMEGVSKTAYDAFVFGKTTHVLKEENYDLIIEKLESLINNK